MKRRKVDLLIEIIIDLMLIAGILLVSLPFLKETMIEIQLQSSQTQLVSELPELVEEETIQPPTIEAVYLNGFNQRFDSYGVVRIPALEWEQPLLVGITNQNLLRGGVVLYPERSLSAHNLVIAGHHLGVADLLFGPLLDVREGMEVEVRYLEEQAVYVVEEIKTVPETDLSILDDQSIANITLFTCPVPQRTDTRFVVRARMLESVTDEVESESDSNSQDMILTQTSILQKSIRPWLRLLFIGLLMLLGVILVRFLFRQKAAEK